MPTQAESANKKRERKYKSYIMNILKKLEYTKSDNAN